MRARVISEDLRRSVLTQDGEPVTVRLRLVESESTPGRVRALMTVPLPEGEAAVTPPFRLEAN